jgi:threonylcarbamoyladenosine tRNA methylthiotransferase MtaB
MVFGADLIAGFPTESEKMFANSLDLIEACGLTYLHVFPFSPRPGTPAARMPQLPRDVVKARAGLLRARGEERLAAFLASQIGSCQPVLVETAQSGRTAQFALTRFAQNMTPGAIVDAHVVSATASHLEVRLAA